MLGRHIILALACVVGVAILDGVTDVSASGDNNHYTHGEDEGYYDEKNINPFDDESFPGDSTMKRAGTQW